MEDAPKHIQLAARATPDASILTYDWRYDASLSTDNNFLDLARAIARNSTSKYGCMGAVLVAGPSCSENRPDTHSENPDATSRSDHPEVLAYAINSPVPRIGDTEEDSELHAEANAITQCVRDGVPTSGATVYITFPPCKSCFLLLANAGIKRMVFRRRLTAPAVVKLASKAEVAIVETTDPAVEEASVARVRKLWDGFYERYPHLLPEKYKKRKQRTPLEEAGKAAKAQKAEPGVGPAGDERKGEEGDAEG